MTHSSESQDDMHRSTRDYVFWKINPGRGRQIGIGENKNEGDEFKGNLFLMKYKHYSTYSSAWTDHEVTWPTCSFTRLQYYRHIQYNYNTQQQYFR